MAALLSHKIGVDAAGEKFILDIRVRSQTASFAHSNAAVYSASQEDEATVFCFRVVQEMTPDPRVNA